MKNNSKVRVQIKNSKFANFFKEAILQRVTFWLKSAAMSDILTQ